MFALVMARLSTAVRQLAERHARLKGEVERVDEVLTEVTTERIRLQAEADAVALVLKSFDVRVDPSQIDPICSHRRWYGRRGSLRASLLKHIRAASTEGISVRELSSALRAEHSLPLHTPALVESWVTNSLKPTLRRLVKEGLVQRRRPDGCGAWRAVQPTAGSLDDLRALEG